MKLCKLFLLLAVFVYHETQSSPDVGTQPGFSFTAWVHFDEYGTQGSGDISPNSRILWLSDDEEDEASQDSAERTFLDWTPCISHFTHTSSILPGRSPTPPWPVRNQSAQE